MKFASEPVERVARLDAETFHGRYLEPNRPVVLMDEVRRWPASERWSVDYLVERFGDRPVRAVVHRDGLYTGHELVHEQTKLEAVLRPEPGSYERLSLVVHVLTLAPYLIPDFSIPSVVAPAEVESSGFWIKPKGTTTGLHFDHQNGLLGVVRGRKRVLLFSPDQVERMYPAPLRELEDTLRRNWSAVRDVFRPDYALFPKLADAVCHEVLLEEGEMLFIPKLWWHAVDNLADVTIGLNFFLSVTPTDTFPIFYQDRVFIERLLAAARGAK